eukprot:scaffold181388_cov28-Tisochrysis_lutea.AAC.3
MRRRALLPGEGRKVRATLRAGMGKGCGHESDADSPRRRTMRGNWICVKMVIAAPMEKVSDS